MRAKPVILGCLLAALLNLTACIVDVGDWQHFSKDFHSSFPLKSGGRLSVESFNGPVDISAWDEDTVDISGTKYGPTQDEADNLRVDIDHTADSVSIRVQRPTDWRRNRGARMTIKVPHGTRLDRVITSNGSIRTEDGVGPTHLKTSNGQIHVTGLHGDLDADTSNSSVELEGIEGNVRAHTSNGHIRAERVNGSLDTGTSNNGVNIDVARADKDVRVETSNSGVELDLPPHFSGNVHVGTSNGPITLHMADDVNARISAHTSNSSIHSDFEVRAQGELSRNRLEGSIGSGGPLIELGTSNGGIRLLKR